MRKAPGVQWSSPETSFRSRLRNSSEYFPKSWNRAASLVSLARNAGHRPTSKPPVASTLAAPWAALCRRAPSIPPGGCTISALDSLAVKLRQLFRFGGGPFPQGGGFQDLDVGAVAEDPAAQVAFAR